MPPSKFPPQQALLPHGISVLEPLSSDAGDARLRAHLEGGTWRGTQAPGGGKGGVGKRESTEGDDESVTNAGFAHQDFTNLSKHLRHKEDEGATSISQD